MLELCTCLHDTICCCSIARLARHLIENELDLARFLARRLEPKLGSLRLGNVWRKFGSARSSSVIFDRRLARLARARKFLMEFWLGSLEPADLLARFTSNFIQFQDWTTKTLSKFLFHGFLYMKCRKFHVSSH